MISTRAAQYPIGNSVTIDCLRAEPYNVLDQLRNDEPVSWIPALEAWFVTSRELAVEAMRDATTYTVQDSRFSTAAVIGQSMLSLDGPKHAVQRHAFARQFRPTIVREQFEADLDVLSRTLVDQFSAHGTAELRTAFAGPLAVQTITHFLGLDHLAPAAVLAQYRIIADAIVGIATGHPIPPECKVALGELRAEIATAVHAGTSKALRTIAAEGSLATDELVTSTLVVLFGAIETSEGMTANALWHLLSRPRILEQVSTDRSLLPAAVEESLRLEPAAAVIDRYTTRSTQLGQATIPEREMVTISLLGANRDPSVFDDAATYNIDRPNLHQHVAFVQGPHSCIGLHLSRLETVKGINAVLDALPEVSLNNETSSKPSGLVFRKPAAVNATWTPAPS